MDQDTIKTLIAGVSVAIATASICINLYLLKARPPSAKKDELRTSLNALLAKVNSSQIVTVQPHYEHWRFGFSSLEELRSLCAASNILIEYSVFATTDVKLTAAMLLEKIKRVLSHRDSLSMLGRPEDSLTYQDYEKWPQRASAENSLRELQQFLTENQRILKNYARELNR
jgi:hypothetical protein